MNNMSEVLLEKGFKYAVMLKKARKYCWATSEEPIRSFKGKSGNQYFEFEDDALFHEVRIEQDCIYNMPKDIIIKLDTWNEVFNTNDSITSFK